MRITHARLLLGGCLSLLGLSLVTVPQPAVQVHAAEIEQTSSDFQALAEEDILFLQQMLAPAKARRSRSVVMTTALMLARNSQAQMKKQPDKAKQLATLRDQAVKIAKLVLDKDTKQAKTIADGLKVDMPSDPNVSAEPRDLVQELKDAEFELYDLMTQFRSTRAYGRGYESMVKDYSEKLADRKKALALGLRMAEVGELTKQFPPLQDRGNKTKAKWVKYCEEMVQASNEAVEVLRAGDTQKAVAAFKKLDASCTSCHNVFRD